MRRWIRPPAATMPPNRIATGGMTSGLWRARNDDENAGEAVARGERGVGAALDRRDLEEAGEPGAGAGDRRAGDDEPPDRQALRERRAKIAAGDARREAEGRARHQDIERDARAGCRRRSPNARRCRESCRPCRRRRAAWSKACWGWRDRAARPRRRSS